jgi:hypothetical protein
MKVIKKTEHLLKLNNLGEMISYSMGNGIFRNTFIYDALDYGICWSGKTFLQET